MPVTVDQELQLGKQRWGQSASIHWSSPQPSSRVYSFLPLKSTTTLSSVNKLSHTHSILSLQQPHGDSPTPISWMRKSNLQINLLMFPQLLTQSQHSNPDPQAPNQCSLHSPIAVYFDNFSSLCLHIISAHPGEEWSSNLLVFWEQPQITGQGRGCGSSTPYAAPKTLLPPT